MGNDEVPTQLVAGKYRLTKLLGRGGMGSVWEGVHSSLGTRVACKFIDAEYADSVEARSRFENEARAAASLRSKHVVEVYDHGVADDGRPYIVMEYLAGEPLDSRLNRAGRLSLADTAHVITHVARALAKAHQAGIVHRDLKPENIFLVWDDEDAADIAKVVDFGIAKFTDNSVGISSATRTGSVLGTPYYMSPEQARGLRTVDYRSDLWSLGVIAFRCVVGRLPFEGEALGDLLVKLCTAPIPIPSQLYPGLPPAFDAWIARSLSREPEGRFTDARSMAQDLTEIAGGSPRSRLSSSHNGEAGRAALPSGDVFGGQRYPSSGGGTPVPSYGTPFPNSQTPGFAHLLPQINTNAALTATPPLSQARSKTPMFVAGAAAVVVLGIGVMVLARALSDDGSQAAASASAPAPGVSVEQPPRAAAPAVAPLDPPLETVRLDDPEEPLEPSLEPPRASRLVGGRKPSGSAKKSTVVQKPFAPAIAPPKAPVSVAEPEAPAAAPKRAVVPAPPKKKPGIDVGY